MLKFVSSYIVISISISLVWTSDLRTDVTVSGISSGGAMATQLHIAFSEEISGCGILAGPPYYCAANGLTTTNCMLGPSVLISPLALKLKMDYYASLNKIDDPSNIKDDPVYVFSGKYDVVASPFIVKLNGDLYTRLGARVKTNYDMPANHAFPTENFGTACNKLNTENFLNNCQFNMAYEMLNYLYGNRLTRPSANTKTPLNGQIVLFNQEAFMDPPSSLFNDNDAKFSIKDWIRETMTAYIPEDWEWSTSNPFNLTMSKTSTLSTGKSIMTRRSSYSFDEQGFIYFPSACINGQKCSIHVALHGCQQGKSFVGDVFVTKAGYLEVAETNNIILIFPQILRSYMLPTNPMGCWDWWGYSSMNYATKSAPQTSGIKHMIDTVRYISSTFHRKS